MSAPRSDERRQARIDVDDAIGLLDGDYEVCDISPGGLFLAGPATRPIGGLVRLQFTVLTPRGPMLHDAVAEVMHHGSDDRAGLGLRFVNPSPEVSEALEHMRVDEDLI